MKPGRPAMNEQLELGLGLFTVHCFRLDCAITVVAADPDEAHALMEEHYDIEHAEYIRAAVWGPETPKAAPR